MLRREDGYEGDWVVNKEGVKQGDLMSVANERTGGLFDAIKAIFKRYN